MSLTFPAIEIRSVGRGSGVFLLDAVAPGTVIAGIDMPSKLAALPDKYTVQVGLDAHLSWPAIAKVNHSCAPTCRIAVFPGRVELIACYQLQVDREVTFFYPSTEWEMAEAFECHCMHDGCLTWINGASEIPPNAMMEYAGFLTDHIRHLWQLSIA